MFSYLKLRFGFNNKKLFFPVLLFLLFVSIIFSLGTGTIHISLAEILSVLLNSVGFPKNSAVTEQQETVLWLIRMPRMCLSISIGAGLALAGAMLQGLFRNPLADPGLIGISSGASLFAVLTILLEIRLFHHVSGLASVYLLSLMAFGGACLTAFLVYQLSKKSGNSLITNMLLIGIAINALAGAITGLLTYLANDEQLRSIVFWGFGSLAGANWVSVSAVAPFVIIALLFMPHLSKSLDLLALGESQAVHLGINLKELRRQVVVLATLAVGTSVAVAGMIGFVGFVVPHLIRQVTGAGHRQVLAGSALGGAALLTLADSLSRIVVTPAELPIGILTALLGTPVFLWLLRKKVSEP